MTVLLYLPQNFTYVQVHTGRYQSDSRISFTLVVCLVEKIYIIIARSKANKIRIFQQNIGIKETLILVTKKAIVIKSPLVDSFYETETEIWAR